MIADFYINDKVDKPRFFQKIFLEADKKFNVILEMLFLILNNADMLFDGGTFTSKL